VIPVADVEAEVVFYVALGSALPALRSPRSRPVPFGMQASEDRIPPQDLRWQIEVDDIRRHTRSPAGWPEELCEPSIHPPALLDLPAPADD
jgi:hypothetical protein